MCLKGLQTTMCLTVYSNIEYLGTANMNTQCTYLQCSFKDDDELTTISTTITKRSEPLWAFPQLITGKYNGCTK